MGEEPSPFLAEGVDPNQPLLLPKKSRSRANSIIADNSTMFAGIMAEEIADINHLDERNATNAGSGYGAVDGEEEHEIEDEEEPEFLVPKTQLYVILPCIFSLIFLASLDSTILTTLLTKISSDLNAIPYLSWLASSYLLSCSIIQPLAKLSDIFGRKPMLLMCIFVFTVGCLQCATASTALAFAMGRFLSGFAGGLNTLGTIIMSDLIPLRKRGVYQGLGNVFYAIGSAVGGTCGGLINEKYGSWRAAFWLQVPIGIFCFCLIMFNLNLPQLEHQIENQKASLRDKLKKSDVTGIASLSLMLLFFVVTTSVKFETTWGFVSSAVLFLVLLAVFIKLELTNRHPIVPIGLLKDRSVLGSSMSNFFGTMYCFAMMFYYPLYLSTILDLNTGEIGLISVPTIVAASLASVGSGYYMKWTGKYLKFAILSMLFGMFGIIYLLVRVYPFNLKVFPTKLEQYLLMIPVNVSYAAMLTVTLLSLIASVPIESQSAVTSIQYAFRGMGSTAGASLGSFVFNFYLQRLLVNKLTENKPEGYSDEELGKLIDKALHNADFINSDKAPGWSVKYLHESYGISCWCTFVFSFWMCVLCLVSICMIKEYTLHSTIKRK